MLTTCEKKRVDNSNLVVSVVCHLVTSAVAPVLPVVPVVSVVVKNKISCRKKTHKRTVIAEVILLSLLYVTS